VSFGRPLTPRKGNGILDGLLILLEPGDKAVEFRTQFAGGHLHRALSPAIQPTDSELSSVSSACLPDRLGAEVGAEMSLQDVQQVELSSDLLTTCCMRLLKFEHLNWILRERNEQWQGLESRQLCARLLFQLDD